MELEREAAGEFSQSTGLSSVAVTPSHSRQQKRVVIDDEPQSDEAALVVKDEVKPKRPVLDQPVIVLQGREVLFAIGIFFLFAVVVSLLVIYITTFTKMKECRDESEQRKKEIEVLKGKNTGLTDALRASEAQNAQLTQDLNSSSVWLADTRLSLNTTAARLEDMELENENLTRRVRMGICDRPGCVKSAVEILDKMNLSASPCDDFWEYSCGSWIAQREIPDSREAWGLDTESDRTFLQGILADLKSPIAKTGNGSVERKYKSLFQICMSAEDTVSGGNQISDIVKNWIICRSAGQKPVALWEACSRAKQKILEELLFTYATDALFSIKVVSDTSAEQPLNLIKVDYGGLGLRERGHYLHRDSHPSTRSLYESYIKRTISAVRGNLTNSSVDQFTESVLSVERELAEIQTQDERNRSANGENEATTVLTVKELQKISQEIKWLDLLRHLSVNISNETEVVVVSREYVLNVQKKILMGRSHRDLENYFTWRLVFHLAPSLSTSLKSSQQSFLNPSRVKPKQPIALKRQRYCQEMIMDSFPYAVVASAAASAARPPGIDRTRRNVTDMVVNIKETLMENITEADWMDNVTKQAATQMLKNLKIEVGFPEFVLNETEVDRYYSSVVVNESLSFFENVLVGLRHKTEVMTSRLESPQDIFDQIWEVNPLQPNVFYSPDDNKIGITFSLLQKPFYDDDRYTYLNYGSLGIMIAHEMIAAIFDDGTRNLPPDWWSSETASNFLNRSRCLKDYHRQLVLQPDQQVVGRLDFGEYIADLGGLYHSYQAYQGWVRQNGEEANLPGLNLSNDQVFFVTFAQNLCKIRRKNERKRTAAQRFPPAEEIRVRGTLFMSDMFQGVYNCPDSPPQNETEAPQCDRLLW